LQQKKQDRTAATLRHESGDFQPGGHICNAAGDKGGCQEF
jgi:hypothetical protein